MFIFKEQPLKIQSMGALEGQNLEFLSLVLLQLGKKKKEKKAGEGMECNFQVTVRIHTPGNGSTDPFSPFVSKP